MNKVIAPYFNKYQAKLDHFISELDLTGEQFGKAARNTIKLFDLNQKISSFHLFYLENLFL